MKQLFLFCLIVISLTKGHGQDQGLYDYDKPEISATVVARSTIDSLTQFEKIVLDGFDSKIPFYHYANNRRGKERYVILLHGLGGNKDYWVKPSMPYFQYTKNLTAIKDSLLQEGFNVVITDAKFHGERSYELNFRNAGLLPPIRSRNVDDAESLYDMYLSSIKEIRLITDYLEERHQVPELKFNLVGYSMGGAFSLILNGVDDRINSVVACVPPLSRPFSEAEELGWTGEIAEKMKEISPLYAATHQMAPVAMLMGRTDFFIPESEARAFYDAITMDDKTLKFYESGHELPDEYIEDVIHWIRKHNP